MEERRDKGVDAWKVLEKHDIDKEKVRKLIAESIMYLNVHEGIHESMVRIKDRINKGELQIEEAILLAYYLGIFRGVTMPESGIESHSVFVQIATHVWERFGYKDLLNVIKYLFI